jgi:hypothetical protein
MPDPLMSLTDAFVPEETDRARDRARQRLEALMHERPAAPAPARRRWRLASPRVRRACAVGGVTAIAVAVGVNLLPASQGASADPGHLLDQAAAAVLPPSSQIFHSVTVVREFGTKDGRPVTSRTRYEEWHLSGVAERTLHTAADGSVLQDEVAAAKELRKHGADGVEQDPDMGLLSALKREAASGAATLTNAGDATINGHQTIKLLFTFRHVFHGTTYEVAKAVLYVDKSTSLPMRLEQHYRPDFPGTEGVPMTKSHDVSDYTLLERLPNTPANRDLLRATHDTSSAHQSWAW